MTFFYCISIILQVKLFYIKEISHKYNLSIDKYLFCRYTPMNTLIFLYYDSME